MDYIKLYYTLCTYCKETPILERITKRNSSDERLLKDYIYTEKHHIIPKHAGGTNDLVNMIELLPEEHFMAHYIRYMAYNDKNDYISIRFMVNGYKNKKFLINEIPKTKLNKMVKMFKQGVGEFRKKHSWHTDDGVKRISESRKNKMHVIEKNTGKKIGMVPVNHPRVINGDWVHHTTGMLSVIDRKNGNKKYIPANEYQKNKTKYLSNTGDVVGENNPRYSGFTDEELLNIVIHFSMYVDMGVIFSYNWIASYYRQFEKYKNLPQVFSKFRFDGKNKSELHRRAAEITGFKINQYFFNKPSRKKEYEQKIKNYKIIC